MAEYPGVSWEVAQRLKTLKGIEEFVKGDGDKFNMMSNVLAIRKAYLSGDLQWNKGLVTYWSNGNKLAEPRPFMWNEFLELNRAHNGDKGFWVEGVSART